MATLLCVHAHPDDEALWTGGLLARHTAHGWPAAVVTCAADLVGPRVGELAESLAVLGAGPPRLLGFGDSGRRPPFAPASLCAADLDEVVLRLVAHIRVVRPDIVVTYDAYGTYGHPDHVRTHRATVAAIEAAAHPAVAPQAGAPWQVSSLYLATWPRPAVLRAVSWLRRHGAEMPADDAAMGVPPETIDVAVDVRPWLDTKWRALCAHRSEFARGDGPARLNRVPPRLRELALGTEWFIRRDLRPPGHGLLSSPAPARLVRSG
ncbi:PIG-L family deacetylase [Asanoa sp. WMMD1127]|uniref:PIG-L family deacetylase n=1 Tax=Asanoa sp. WMMD1127 TaxID=3016107 RepID=UPI0024172759|nr:PIG-L family deacetylase [Asanoa sp. WMMD1127]MDG4820777.1 PIG-L family deacetylase [Asanoa sp. WMMD1127]